MLKASSQSLVLIALLSSALLVDPVGAQTAVQPKPAAKPATAPAAKAPAAKPAPLSPAQKAAAATTATAAALSPGQLHAAERVMTGTAKCEFGEEVQLTSESGKPGYFVLRHKHHSYHMVPEETTTGAVRLEDKKQGIMWLQIPSKSMLMNTRIGQRLIDDCMMSPQQG